MDDPRWRTAGPDEPLGAASSSGVRDQLTQLVSALASGVDTRIRLALLDLAEERERTRDRVVLTLLTAGAALFSVLALNTLIVVLLWDALGWRSVALAAVFWLLATAVAAWRLLRLTRRATPPFTGILAELERDRRWLTERFGRRTP